MCPPSEEKSTLETPSPPQKKSFTLFIEIELKVKGRPILEASRGVSASIMYSTISCSLQKGGDSAVEKKRVIITIKGRGLVISNCYRNVHVCQPIIEFLS